MRAKVIMPLLLITAVVTGLTACGDNSADRAESEAASSITIDKDGSIKSRIVEDFAQDYFDADELKELIESSVASYTNQSQGAQVSLVSCERTGDNKLNLEMSFNDYNSYASWNNFFLDYMYDVEIGYESDTQEADAEGFFAGTIQDAYAAGYDLDVTLSAVSDKSEKQSVTKEDLLGMGDRHIVILERDEDEESADVVRVNCFGDIMYVGEGVTAAGKKSADISLTNGYGIIVFK